MRIFFLLTEPVHFSAFSLLEDVVCELLIGRRGDDQPTPREDYNSQLYRAVGELEKKRRQWR